MDLTKLHKPQKQYSKYYPRLTLVHKSCFNEINYFKFKYKSLCHHDSFQYMGFLFWMVFTLLYIKHYQRISIAFFHFAQTRICYSRPGAGNNSLHFNCSKRQFFRSAFWSKIVNKFVSLKGEMNVILIRICASANSSESWGEKLVFFCVKLFVR